MDAFFDLASLAKPLVTAPLVLDLLQDPAQGGAALLDQDLRAHPALKDLAGAGRPGEALTLRRLLSHSAGLPPWRPWRGSLAATLEAPVPAGAHPLLREALPDGEGGPSATYSDLGYALLAEVAQRLRGRDFTELGRASGLIPAPWNRSPEHPPLGPDAEAWALAAPDLPLPPTAPGLPHDTNARAGMRGHAGWGADAAAMKVVLESWIASGYPARMAQAQSRDAAGMVWGLGLHRAHPGAGRFGQLLERARGLKGVHVVVDTGTRLDPPAPSEAPPGPPGPWWMHVGYTGCALFVRPEDGCCIALLLNRLGPGGGLLNPEEMRGRRWRVLEGFLG